MFKDKDSTIDLTQELAMECIKKLKTELKSQNQEVNEEKDMLESCINAIFDATENSNEDDTHDKVEEVLLEDQELEEEQDYGEKDKIHRLALMNVFKIGTEELMKKNIKEIRDARKKMNVRIAKFNDFIYQQSQSQNSRYKEQLNRLRNVGTTITHVPLCVSLFHSLNAQNFNL